MASHISCSLLKNKSFSNKANKVCLNRTCQILLRDVSVSVQTMKCGSSSLSSCYAHSVYAALLAPRLSRALTYSTFALSCSVLFQLFLDAPSRALFSASLDTKAGCHKCCFKNTFCCANMCQEAGFT